MTWPSGPLAPHRRRICTDGQAPALDDDALLAALPAPLPRVLGMFDAAQTAIFELMRRDSFPRYQRSPQFAALKQQLERRAFLGRETSAVDSGTGLGL